MDSEKLADRVLRLPPPPHALAHVAYQYKTAMSEFAYTVVEPGDRVARGDTVAFWGGTASTALRDMLFASLIEKATGRLVTATRILSPVSGVVTWVPRAVELGADWDAPDPAHDVARIRPFADDPGAVRVASAYRELIAFAERHGNGRRFRDDPQWNHRHIAQAIDAVRRAEPLWTTDERPGRT